MRMKRSKFLTVLFSLIPGAGHMFMGFMKTGVSLMAAFTTIIFLASWLNISPLLYILPVLWFYSFFDCLNRRYSSDEVFASLEDNYLFSIETFSLKKLLAQGEPIFKRRHLMAGILLLLLGGYLVWSNLLSRVIGQFVSDRMYSALWNMTHFAPQFILGIAIIVIGVRLILGRKKERDSDV